MRALLLLAALVGASASAQPFRLLDINPNGSDRVTATRGFGAYTQGNVNRSLRHRNAFVQFNGEAYFTADDGTTGEELWRTNGTPEGTALVADLATGTPSSFPSNLVVYQGALFFSASVGGTPSLWRYDGFEVRQVVDRPLSPRGIAPGRVGLLLGGEGALHVLGSCDEGATGPFCAIEQLISGNLSEAVGLNDASYFVRTSSGNGVAYRSLLTPETTGEIFPQRDQGPDNIATTLGRFYRVGGALLQTCFYETGPSDENGGEMCRSLGGLDDIALLQDLVPGPQSSDPRPIGVYGGELFAVARNPAQPSEFLVFATSGANWRQVSASARDFYQQSTADEVFMLPASGAMGFLTTRALSDGPFPETELALFASSGSQVTADGTGWRVARTAEAEGYFVAAE
ncbi:MAG: ELWxxDGT repeat protein [Bacteroidota bacterium]